MRLLVYVALGLVVAAGGGTLLLEFVLRSWRKELPALERRGGFDVFGSLHKGSHKLATELVATRDPYFSSVHWEELQRYRDSGFMTTDDWSPKNTNTRLNRLSATDFIGREFSVRNRERTTTDHPPNHQTEVLCLGGSTTFCYEVADRYTWPSQLQRSLNEDGSSKVCVRNLGIGGTPGLERIRTYQLAMAPKSGDIGIFLLGDNDSGWKQYELRSGMAHDNLPFLLRQLLYRGTSRSELAGWLYGELAPRYLRRLAVEMAETTIAAAEDAAKFAQSRGANVLFVLQPNIFTLARPDDWDRKIIAGTARDLPIMLAAAYERYREWIADSPIAVDATHLFDGESPSPYMGDWAHVNTRGNRLIGEFVFDQLKTRGLLAPTANLG